MNELALKELWKTTNENLEKSYVLNYNNTEDITRIKVHINLNSMKQVKIVTLLLGFLWVGFGTFILSHIYLNNFLNANKFFLFSATIQVMLTAIAFWIYLYQLVKINNVKNYDPILETQEKLVQLSISTLWSARILFLQLPVWTTFWWTETMLTNWTTYQWTITIFITLIFSCASLWLFINIKYENRNTKWFQLIFKGKEWTPLMKSMELLEQLKEYK